MERQQSFAPARERITREDRVRITNAIRERTIELYNRRYAIIHGFTVKAMSLAGDAAFNEFVDGTLIQL